jgi:hypothetical protein
MAPVPGLHCCGNGQLLSMAGTENMRRSHMLAIYLNDHLTGARPRDEN